MAENEQKLKCNAKDMHGLEYGWCSGLKVEHSEGDDHFCMFHAPRGKKKVSVTKFNAQVIGKIKQAKEAGTECDLTGTVFEGDFELPDGFSSKDSPLPDLDFSWAQFMSANFKSANFKGVHYSRAVFQNANFNSAKFEKVDFCYAQFESADFSYAEFNKKADFKKSRFKEVEFRGVQFQTVQFHDALFERVSFCEASFNIAYFHSAKFKSADFSKTEFKNAEFKFAKFDEASFVLAKFKDGDFTGATFKHGIFGFVHFDTANFMSSKFERAVFLGANIIDANFNRSNCEELDFSGAEIKKILFLHGKISKGKFAHMQLESANFEETIFVTEVSFYGSKFKYIDFANAVFKGSVDFQFAEFQDNTVFNKSTFGDKFIDFRNVVIAKGNYITLQNINLTKTAFLETDISRIDFIGAHPREEAGRYILYDEDMFYEDEGKGIFNSDKERKERLNQLEELYRAGKSQCHAKHNMFEYPCWHMSEKEMQRRRLKGTLTGAVLSIYKSISGYGEEPKRAAWWLLGLVVAGIIIMSSFGIISTDQAKEIFAIVEVFEVGDITGITINYKSFPNTFNYSLETLTYMKTPDFKPANNWTRAARIFFRLATTLQFTLFAFALRNRFRR